MIGQARRDAIAAIASGKVGGPVAVLDPLIGTLAGVESEPIRFEKDGLARKVSIPGALEQGIAGIPSFADPTSWRSAQGSGTRELP